LPNSNYSGNLRSPLKTLYLKGALAMDPKTSEIISICLIEEFGFACLGAATISRNSPFDVDIQDRLTNVSVRKFINGKMKESE
jgi:hypothetical protein